MQNQSEMQSQFEQFINEILPRFEYDGVKFTNSPLINDGYLYYVDSFISVTRDFHDGPIIWATLNLRLMYNKGNNSWSAFKIWEFLTNPYTSDIKTYKTAIIRNVNFMEAVWDITNVMRYNLDELAEYDSYTLDISFNWPSEYFINDISEYSIETN